MSIGFHQMMQECPFAHPQEKARRRDPRTHSYTGIACPSMKREGTCAFGDWCPYAHNVFEYWLHPTRYRTQLCNDGSNCNRKICFFAHSLDELRVPETKPFVSPEALATAAAAASSENDAQRRTGTVGPPSADLDLTPVQMARMSIESVRQSQDWGPVPMPRNETNSSSDQSSNPEMDEERTRMDSKRNSRGKYEKEFELVGSIAVERTCPSQVASFLDSNLSAGTMPAASVPEMRRKSDVKSSDNRFTGQEQSIIEAITSMLAKDNLSPQQAAALLQQMLPAASLNTLQSCLHSGGVSTASPIVDQNRVMDLSFSRPSMESSRSSFDTARVSLETNRQSSEFSTPRASIEGAYGPPFPAYPQYWASSLPASAPLSASGGYSVPLSNQLYTVHEGVPVLHGNVVSQPIAELPFQSQPLTSVDPEKAFNSSFFMSDSSNSLQK